MSKTLKDESLPDTYWKELHEKNDIIIENMKDEIDQLKAENESFKDVIENDEAFTHSTALIHQEQIAKLEDEIKRLEENDYNIPRARDIVLPEEYADFALELTQLRYVNTKLKKEIENLKKNSISIHDTNALMNQLPGYVFKTNIGGYVLHDNKVVAEELLRAINLVNDDVKLSDAIPDNAKIDKWGLHVRDDYGNYIVENDVIEDMDLQAEEGVKAMDSLTKYSEHDPQNFEDLGIPIEETRKLNITIEKNDEECEELVEVMKHCIHSIDSLNQAMSTASNYDYDDEDEMVEALKIEEQIKEWEEHLDEWESETNELIINIVVGILVGTSLLLLFTT